MIRSHPNRETLNQVRCTSYELDQMPSSCRSPEQELFRKEADNITNQMLSDLEKIFSKHSSNAKRNIEIFVLHFADGMTYREIAKDYRIGEQRVWKIIQTVIVKICNTQELRVSMQQARTFYEKANSL